MSPVSVGFDVMAAAVVVAVDQHVAHAGFAHLAEGDLLRDVAVELAKYPEVGPGIIGRVVGKDPARASRAASLCAQHGQVGSVTDKLAGVERCRPMARFFTKS